MTEDTARKRIRERIRALDLDLATVSRRLGKNHAYMQQFLMRGTPKKLPLEVVLDLARMLDVPPQDLTPYPLSGGVDVVTDKERKVREAGVTLDRGEPVYTSDWPRNLPVYGMTRGGDGEGFELNTGDPIDFVARPPGLLGARTAFALYVEGESMSPVFEPGSVVIVHPGRPVTPGCYCVVELSPTGDGDNPRAYLKRLVRRGPDKMVVEQINPPSKMTFHLADIRAIYRVLTVKELLGI